MGAPYSSSLGRVLSKCVLLPPTENWLLNQLPTPPSPRGPRLYDNSGAGASFPVLPSGEFCGIQVTLAMETGDLVATLWEASKFWACIAHKISLFLALVTLPVKDSGARSRRVLLEGSGTISPCSAVF
jgi:hypothetical protein